MYKISNQIHVFFQVQGIHLNKAGTRKQEKLPQKKSVFFHLKKPDSAYEGPQSQTRAASGRQHTEDSSFLILASYLQPAALIIPPAHNSVSMHPPPALPAPAMHASPKRSIKADPSADYSSAT